MSVCLCHFPLFVAKLSNKRVNLITHKHASSLYGLVHKDYCVMFRGVIKWAYQLGARVNFHGSGKTKLTRV